MIQSRWLMRRRPFRDLAPNQVHLEHRTTHLVAGDQLSVNDPRIPVVDAGLRCLMVHRWRAGFRQAQQQEYRHSGRAVGIDNIAR